MVIVDGAQEDKRAEVMSDEGKVLPDKVASKAPRMVTNVTVLEEGPVEATDGGARASAPFLSPSPGQHAP